jgi:quinol monooxygenase YgiN
MRVLHTNISPEKYQEFRKFYDDKIIPELQKIPGCLCASLMQSDQHLDEYISMTLWEKQEDAETYDKGLFQELLSEARPYLANSSEWKIQLSEDFTLEYEAVEEEPTVQSYPIITQTNGNICVEETPQLMYMRVVSLKIQPGKLEEFKRLYTSEIIPALRAVKGCRYAYLTDNLQVENEVFSVTMWNTKKDAENYERSGLFDKLKERVKHTFSELYQWKMTLEKESGKKLATSEDMKVHYYSIITGKKFH